MGVLMVVGYGPGISHAVVARFAREGHSVALVARTSERAEAAADQLRAAGVAAAAYQADASDPTAIRRAAVQARHDLGPVSALLWTAFRNGGVRNVLATAPEDVERVFDIGVVGLLACVQEVLEDLKSRRRPGERGQIEARRHPRRATPRVRHLRRRDHDRRLGRRHGHCRPFGDSAGAHRRPVLGPHPVP